MSDEPNQAVFLSYASQDADAARTIAEAMRVAGIEVWFDRSELRGGDAWDAKIRRQIKECTLFVPVISANTNARPEGYFRLEWKLAVDRSHLMADDQPFLFPIVIGDVADATARVPDKFRDVQWTRLRLDETPTELARRISALLKGEPIKSSARAEESAIPRSAHGGGEKKRLWDYWWVIFPLVGMITGLIISWRHVAPRDRGVKPTVVDGKTADAPPISEARRLAEKARELIETLDSTRDDLSLAEDLMKQALAKDSTDAEVWASQAQVQSRFNTRGFDHSETRSEQIRSSLQRALRLDPHSFEARFASTMISSQYGLAGGETERTLRELRAERPKDQRVLRALGSLISRLGRTDEAAAIDDESAALPGGDPLALYNKAWGYYYAGRSREGQAALKASLAQKPFSSSLLANAFFTLVFDGDLDAAKRAFEAVPGWVRSEDRAAIFASLIYGWRREPDDVVANLRVVPRDWLDDNFFRGPRELLAGDAMANAGRMEAATAAWQTALHVTNNRLAANPSDNVAVVSRIYLLAALGEKDKAAAELRAFEQAHGNGFSLTSPMPSGIRATYLKLGRGSEVVTHVRELLTSSKNRGLLFSLALTSADLRFDPQWDPVRKDPAFAELLTVTSPADTEVTAK